MRLIYNAYILDPNFNRENIKQFNSIIQNISNDAKFLALDDIKEIIKYLQNNSSFIYNINVDELKSIMPILSAYIKEECDNK